MLSIPNDPRLIHKFEKHRRKFAIDVNSFFSFEITDLVWDIFDAIDSESPEVLMSKLNQYDREEVLAALEELGELEANGMLFSEDSHSAPKMNLQEIGHDLASLTLNIAHTCNLNCQYCFNYGGSYGRKAALMDFETAKNSIDFFLEHSGKNKKLDLGFFGGEPMLNFDVIKSSVEYAIKMGKNARKEFLFGITTNGTILTDEMLEFLNHFGFFIIVSLDGPPDVNDKLRIYHNGHGSHDIVLRNLKRLSKSRNGEGFTVRGTYTHQTLDFFRSVQYLATQGFKSISMEAAALPKNHPGHLTMDDLKVIQQQYDKLSMWYIEQIRAGLVFDFFHFRNLILDLYHGKTRTAECAAGHRYLLVTPSGDLHPCHWFPITEEYKLGNVNTKEYYPEVEEIFQGIWVNSRLKCQKCWAKYYCGGGCMAHAYLHHKDILIPDEIYCNMIKCLVENAVWIYTILDEEDLLEEYIGFHTPLETLESNLIR